MGKTVKRKPQYSLEQMAKIHLGYCSSTQIRILHDWLHVATDQHPDEVTNEQEGLRKKYNRSIFERTLLDYKRTRESAEAVGYTSRDFDKASKKALKQYNAQGRRKIR